MRMSPSSSETEHTFYTIIIALKKFVLLLQFYWCDLNKNTCSIQWGIQIYIIQLVSINLLWELLMFGFPVKDSKQ